jgi:hypothetical protein
MGLAAMHPNRFRTVPQRHLVWLLWLVLLLPVAQVTASWHAMSHVAIEAGGASDPQHAPHQNHCELCLTAAAVDGGVPLVASSSLALEAIRHALPRVALVALWVASPAQAYLSRAPPVASR